MEVITGNIFQITTKLMNLPQEDKQKIFDVSEHKEKRSLSQNAYAYKLINEIANKTNISKEQVHFDMLKHYSQVSKIMLRADIDIKGFIPYYELEGYADVKGTKYAAYKIYKPSHEMNTYEMSVYLNGIIMEAENLGIPTLSEEKIKEMKLI